MMRPVLVSWIEWEKIPESERKEMFGQTKRQVKREAEGKFHGWGLETEEGEQGPASYSVALVELPNGSVKTFTPACITFLDVKGY